jgi:hypothetical protein
MHHHRLTLLAVVASLSCSLSFLQAKAPPAPIVGTWELVGIGDVSLNQLSVGPHRLQIVVSPSGTFDYRLWENEDGAPFKVSGNWTLAGDLFTMTPWDGERLKAAETVYQVAWDGGTLLLYEREDGNRPPPPERFERQVGGTP